MSVNKVAVVTGGASGIGKAISQQLAQEGVAVSVWDLNADATQATVDEIVAAGGQAIGCVGDAADKAAIADNAQKTREAFGAITILVNNAGITGFIPFLEIDEETVDRILRINVKGPLLCCQEMIPDMLEAGWGRIVNVTSSSAQTGAARMVHYATSKGGVMSMTKSLAMEYADKGITVNNIPPGFIDTPMMRASPIGAALDQVIAASPMKRAGQPEDIAAACSYLVSDAAAYVTGQTINVNGGRYIC
ncbi:SDR family NAD(P)-dependent oxidoreductase [Halioxenophilus sp. WMMB6]|uniref:SDR family NAD(P)-dependent oxidoreductase n=1 Tax=Halioxenophilus sp. WMMB6 TaxID=3073815 RepID=UPI00295EAC22|nr:SDR family NAD(P)-dependent oxidoreductase [Halioxenophilus sp. WMMB6]